MHKQPVLLYMKTPASLLTMFSLVITFSLNAQSRAIWQDNSDDLQQYSRVAKSVIKLFKSYSLVALDEGHHSSKAFHGFLLALLNEKRFPIVINDIVVEFGASRYQTVMDDYIMGKAVPDSILSLCWRETTQVLVWDSPVYKTFFCTVRELNKQLPEKRKVRVLLGDPPIRWENVNTIQDWVIQANRDEFAFRLIEKEVLLKARKALIIYGGLHLQKKDIRGNYGPMPHNRAGLGELIANKYPSKMAAIWTRVNTNDRNVKTLITRTRFKFPALIKTKNSLWGTLGFNEYCDIPINRVQFSGDSIIAVQKNDYRNCQFSKVFDGLLLLSPIEKLVEPVPFDKLLFKDEIYLREMIRRCSILQHPELSQLLEWKLGK